MTSFERPCAVTDDVETVGVCVRTSGVGMHLLDPRDFSDETAQGPLTSEGGRQGESVRSTTPRFTCVGGLLSRGDADVQVDGRAGIQLVRLKRNGGGVRCHHRGAAVEVAGGGVVVGRQSS